MHLCPECNQVWACGSECSRGAWIPEETLLAKLRSIQESPVAGLEATQIEPNDVGNRETAG